MEIKNLQLTFHVLFASIWLPLHTLPWVRPI